MQIKGSAEYYYSKGILTGFAVAIEMAEECESVAELIAKLRRRVKGANNP